MKDAFGWLDQLDGVERDEVDGFDELSKQERGRIRRLDAEVFGLLPLELDPVEPSDGLKARVLSEAARASGTKDVLSESPKVVPFTAPATPPSVASRGRWPLALAAGLAVLGIGLSVTMFGRVQRQESQLAQLQARVETFSAETDDYQAIRSELELARENLQLVSSRGVEICALRPTLSEPNKDMHGILFVAADHQHWYVKVEGLEEAPGKWYQVWFITDEGPVAAGNLIAGQLEDAQMPEGTKGVQVTLETVPEPVEPSERAVLFGDGADMIRTL